MATLRLTRRNVTERPLTDDEVGDLAGPLGEVMPPWLLHPLTRACLAIAGPVMRRDALPRPVPQAPPATPAPQPGAA